jgi:hypothetical protein
MTSSTTDEDKKRIISRLFVKEDGTIIITEAWEELLKSIDEDE